MTAGSTVLRGGELNAAITSALVGIHNAQLGRGPKTATTFHKDNVIVTIMYDVMTQFEHLGHFLPVAQIADDAASRRRQHPVALDGLLVARIGI